MDLEANIRKYFMTYWNSLFWNFCVRSLAFRCYRDSKKLRKRAAYPKNFLLTSILIVWSYPWTSCGSGCSRSRRTPQHCQRLQYSDNCSSGRSGTFFDARSPSEPGGRLGWRSRRGKSNTVPEEEEKTVKAVEQEEEICPTLICI